MKPNFFIKYHGATLEKDSEIDLVALGESIVGFDEVIKEIFKISKVKGEITVSASKTREGSLIIDVLIFITDIAEHVPFEKINDFLDFLKVVDREIWEQANNFFSTIDQAHREINDYFAKNPFDLTLVTSFVAYMIGRAGKHKKQPDLHDLPKQYALFLHKMIKKGKFKKALKPFVENEVSAIEISNEEDFQHKQIIDTDNFDSYLSEKEQVLPDYEDSKVYVFTGTIVSMQCSRGDSMKLRIHGFPKRFRDLVAFPPHDQTTKDFDKFYGQTVVAKASIERKSLYQKPKLYILEMNLQQKPLFEEKNN